jgi:hypothetical protein
MLPAVFTYEKAIVTRRMWMEKLRKKAVGWRPEAVGRRL